MFGMGLVLLEERQPGLEQRLELGIVGRWYQGTRKRVVDRLVIGNFVFRIGLVECFAFERRKRCILDADVEALKFGAIVCPRACAPSVVWSLV